MLVYALVSLVIGALKALTIGFGAVCGAILAAKLFKL